MKEISPILDTIIKAPLWLFFAALLGFSLLSIQPWPVERMGLPKEVSLFGVPAGIYAIVAGSLWLSSALARAGPSIRDWIRDWIWRRRIRGLDLRARSLLELLEEDAISSFLYAQHAMEISALRDKNIIHAGRTSGTGHNWGRFYLSSSYEKIYERNRGGFRSVLRSDRKSFPEFRSIIAKASREADDRI